MHRTMQFYGRPTTQQGTTRRIRRATLAHARRRPAAGSERGQGRGNWGWPRCGRWSNRWATPTSPRTSRAATWCFSPAKRQKSDAMAKALAAALVADGRSIEMPVLIRTGSETRRDRESDPLPGGDEHGWSSWCSAGLASTPGWQTKIDKGGPSEPEELRGGRPPGLPLGARGSGSIHAGRDVLGKHHRNDLVSVRNWRTVTALAEMTHLIPSECWTSPECMGVRTGRI